MDKLNNRMEVLITCPPMLKNIDEFRPVFNRNNISIITPKVVQFLTEDHLMDLIPNVDGWIIGDDPATEKVFKVGKNGKLKAVVKWGVGVDNVDLKACEMLKIAFANTPKMFGNEVADLSLSYLIGLARESYFIDREVRKGNWIKPTGISIAGKTVAVIGLGDIGRACVKRLKPLDVIIIAYDPFVTDSAEEVGVDAILSFPDRIEEVDFIILTCSLTPTSRHIINKQSISRMKDGVRIINVARGLLIDESELIKALQSGKIHSAALDVFETEPLSLNHPLYSFERCILGTHNGSNTIEAVRRTSYRAIELLFGFLNI